MAALILDVEGALHVSSVPLPGAVDAVRRLRAAGHRLRFLTNVTTRSRSRLVDELRGMGFEIGEEEVQTPATAARILDGRRVFALTLQAIREDLAGSVELVERDAELLRRRPREAGRDRPGDHHGRR